MEGPPTAIVKAGAWKIRPVSASDIARIVRECDYPAMLDNPLRLVQFNPASGPESMEEEIQMGIEGLESTFENPTARFRMICNEHGRPVGFALWTIDQLDDGRIVRPVCPGGKEDPKPRDSRPPPAALNVKAWIEVSARLQAERRRALREMRMIWRR